MARLLGSAGKGGDDSGAPSRTLVGKNSFRLGDQIAQPGLPGHTEALQVVVGKHFAQFRGR